VRHHHQLNNLICSYHATHKHKPQLYMVPVPRSTRPATHADTCPPPPFPATADAAAWSVSTPRAPHCHAEFYCHGAMLSSVDRLLWRLRLWLLRLRVGHTAAAVRSLVRTGVGSFVGCEEAAGLHSWDPAAPPSLPRPATRSETWGAHDSDHEPWQLQAARQRRRMVGVAVCSTTHATAWSGGRRRTCRSGTEHSPPTPVTPFGCQAAEPCVVHRPGQHRWCSWCRSCLHPGVVLGRL